MRVYINMKETRIFASPFGMVEQTKEERLQWAEDNGMVWSVTWFLSSINCDMINTDTYQFDSYEAENDSMVSINIVELASEFAHQKVISNSQSEEDIINADGTYTEITQDDFNQYYDEYYNLILNCK